MSRNMYAVAGDCPGNEELALQIQTGDRSAAELLVARNEGYLTDLAKGHTAWCELEDLKQEGAMGDRRKFCVIDVPRQYENLRLSQE